MSKSSLLYKPNNTSSDIKVLLMNYITKKDYNKNIKLPQNTIEILKILIINSTNEFELVSNSLQKIIDDNKIDFKDIPEFIILIENLYILIVRHRKKLAPFSGKTLAVTSGEILKIIIRLLVEMDHFSLSKFINVDINDDAFPNNSESIDNENDNDNQIIDIKRDEKTKLIQYSNNIIDVCIKLLLIPINNDCKIARKMFSCCC